MKFTPPVRVQDQLALIACPDCQKLGSLELQLRLDPEPFRDKAVAVWHWLACTNPDCGFEKQAVTP